MRIIIVMTYLDRQYQLTKTLDSIKRTVHKDFEIIIVDDQSLKHPSIGSYPFPIDVYRTRNKRWIDGSPAYNQGIFEALKRNPDIIILQNAECYHVGDVLSYAERVTDSSYISFACFNLSRAFTFREHDISWLIANYNVPAGDNENNAWLNHKIIRPMGYHWCSAITAKNMRILNGFDERFSDGYWYEDDELLERIKHLGLKIEITNRPFVVHQWHERGYIPQNKNKLIEVNKKLFDIVRESDQVRAIHKFTKDV